MGDQRIENAIDACLDSKPRERIGIRMRTMVAVHRCGMGSDAASIAAGYRTNIEARRATGGRMPYAFVVHDNGRIEQAAYLCDVTPHVRQWNRCCVGIGCIGDFREEPPSKAQFDSLVWLCSRFTPSLSAPRNVWGHDELDGATRYAGKRCPGQYFDMSALRIAVDDAVVRLPAHWGIAVEDPSSV